MGTITDPSGRVLIPKPAPKPVEMPAPKPETPPEPRRTRFKSQPLSLAGFLAVAIGVCIFAFGALRGVELLTMGLGLAFCIGGSFARGVEKKKVCPACRFPIPWEASLCGHCRTEVE